MFPEFLSQSPPMRCYLFVDRYSGKLKELRANGLSSDGLSRLIQGIVTGIGFIGAGSILKQNDEPNVRGLTTSAGIWMASAIGVAVGLGEIGLAILATVLTLIILRAILPIDRIIDNNGPADASTKNDKTGSKQE